ncbi:MAG TPA: glycosyltransferase [Longimicrobium sp.]|nr:glycosyltransferase [Longimicrobium sp.]
MRVGLNTASLSDGLTSLSHVAAAFQEALSERHDLVLLPADYYNVSQAERAAMAYRLVESCDVIVSQPDPNLLDARMQLSSPVPLCMLLLGSLPRGFFALRPLIDTVRASDVMVANCTADVAIAENMFENACVRLLPFGYRERTFYPPTEEETAAMRARLRIPPAAPLVLYAGRATVEKNIHTVLKVFAQVHAAVPEAHLVLAGKVDDVPFAEFGVFPLHLKTSLHRMISRLGLAGRVHQAGGLGADDLRALYGAADVAVNFTLHHDENFGLGPVEAMACGTPVVGTRWGGLQDTIAHGEAGFQVSTVMSANGVKSSWWEAANRIVQLLRDPELRAAFGERGRRIARERYSAARHARLLDRIVDETVRRARSPSGPLRETEFTREFWATCAPHTGKLPPARRSPAAYELYRRLLAPYTGTAPGAIAPEAPLSPDQVVVLANAVSCNEDGSVAVNDPQFPFDVDVPAEAMGAVRAQIGRLLAEPVTTAGALVDGVDAPCARQALGWMLKAGLVMRAAPELDAIPPALAHRPGSTPLLSIRRVEHPADIIYVA